MSTDEFPVGMEIDVTYPQFSVTLTLISTEQLKFDIKSGPFARSEIVDIEVVALGNGLFAVSWQESSGATVTNVQDYDRARIFSFVTFTNGQFLRMAGTFEVRHPAQRALSHLPESNKVLVHSAMTSLFQRRDASAVDALYAEDYVQHNPEIPQGRKALRELVAKLPDNVYYEPGLIVAEGDLVAIHGRIRGWAETPQVVVDIFRIREGRLAEHWDVLQNEVSSSASAGRLGMFDPSEFEPLGRPT